MNMKKMRVASLMAALVSLSLFAAAPVRADSDHGKGHGKGKQERSYDRSGERRVEGRGDVRVELRFGDRERVAVRQYYDGERQRSGRCPPGLAKKNNGCMPPGQAKKWFVGKPLPPDVVVYEVPPQLVVQLGVPPSGYKYVRVASDILMVAIGTSMVMDAIQDLGRM
jgi:hypothetical protein